MDLHPIQGKQKNKTNKVKAQQVRYAISNANSFSCSILWKLKLSVGTDVMLLIQSAALE